MDKGKVEEFDTVSNLLSRPSSFRQLSLESGTDISKYIPPEPVATLADSQGDDGSSDASTSKRNDEKKRKDKKMKAGEFTSADMKKNKKGGDNKEMKKSNRDREGKGTREE